MFQSHRLLSLFTRPTRNQFVILVTLLIILLFNWPVVSMMSRNIELNSTNGLVTLGAVFTVIFLVTTFVLHVAFLLSVRLGKALVVAMVLPNSLALYFMTTYKVILDKTMIGNILNTQTSEASQYFSLTMIVFLLVFGVLPTWWIIRTPVTRRGHWKTLLQLVLLTSASVAVIWASASSWLWIDKHGRVLGGTILPWSYVFNSVRYYQDYAETNAEQVLLPDGSFKNDNKSVVVLVIGESARSDNFSLYGYERETNPHMRAKDVVALPNSQSCASYTTAAVACILSHVPSDEMDQNYEPLPSYLQRQGVEVIWRTKNWGEPPINVSSYLKSGELAKNCEATDCQYDGVLLSGLKEQIEQSQSEKIFVVLHQTGSHGPTYYKKYPPEFERFSPVCESVELSDCSHEALINAYDNTVLYTDDFLQRLKEMLAAMDEAESSFIYLSDHGESLGENGLYLHGTPYSLAPAHQLNIPFIVWASERFTAQHQLSLETLRTRENNDQSLIFHSVMGALGLTSPIYNPDLDLYHFARKP